jgi:Zn-dependent peptidase ImmA (M78 family)/transcriptional regulator with XRE-family HTH domain
VPIDLVEFGNKIHRRRTELLLSQDEVGQNTGMTVERIEEFENGRLSPTGDEVLILADFFRCDYRFLISNERLAASEQTESLYRKYGNEFTKQDRRAILEFLYLCECEQMLKEELGHQTVEFNFVVTGTHFKGHAEQAASALRAHFGYPSNAVPSDVYDDFRKIGFHLFRRRLDNSSISGITIRHPYAGTCILVNYDEDIYRQRFTAAHEGAHGIIDRGEDIVVSFVGKHRRADLVEIRANTFASRYLLPSSVITSLPITRWTQQSIVHWASHFKVSTKALAIALKDAGIVDDHAMNHLAQVSVPAVLKTDPELDKLSEHAKTRKRELLEKGLSTSYVNLCFDAYAHGIISGGRIAEMMLVDNFELNEIAELFNVKMQTQ